MTDANKLAQTLAERGSRYGDFTVHARICQNLKRIMCAEAGWDRLTDGQKQSLEVIADKVGRILSGDPNYADNWHDIQGYAKLAEDRLPPEFGQQNTIDCRSDEQKGPQPDPAWTLEARRCLVCLGDHGSMPCPNTRVTASTSRDQDVRLSDALDARTLTLAAKAFRP